MSKPTDMYSVAFEAAPIAHIVVDAGGTLAMYNDRARSLFGLVPADVGRPFHELELSYRPVELRSMIQDAQAHRRLVVVKDVRLEGRDSEPRTLDVQVTPLFDPQGRGLGASVTFADASRVQELQQQLSRSKQDLESTYEELQSTNEELETTNEELQTTVEELETTNEELQSTNEELETMNEELQSTNEELQSINRELRDRSEALNDVNDFLESIMRGLRGAVIVVNQELHVIAWNHRSEEMWGLRAAEVRNKNVFGLDIGLPVEQFRRELRACLSGEREVANLTVQATNRRGKPARVHRDVHAALREGPDPGRDRDGGRGGRRPEAFGLQSPVRAGPAGLHGGTPWRSTGRKRRARSSARCTSGSAAPSSPAAPARRSRAASRRSPSA